VILWLGVVAALAALATTGRLRLLALCYLFGLLFQNWMVTSIEPYVFAERHMIRVFLPLLLQSIVLLAVFAAMACAYAYRHSKVAGTILALILLAASALALRPLRLERWLVAQVRSNPIRRLVEGQRRIDTARSENICVAVEIPARRGEDGAILIGKNRLRKYLVWYRSLFTEDSEILSRRYRLPESAYFVDDAGQALVVVREGTAPDRILIVKPVSGVLVFRETELPRSGAAPIQFDETEPVYWHGKRYRPSSESH
jgi:hypothetical protein